MNISKKSNENECNVIIDNVPFSFKVIGDFFSGENKTLFQQKDNLITDTHWEKDGFSVVKSFNNSQFTGLKESIKKNIYTGLKKAGIDIPYNEFLLKDYHKYINSQTTHLKVIEHTRNLRTEDFDIDFEALATQLSKHVNSPLTAYIKELKRSHVQIRLNRPNSLDINPPHRDGYLSYWENILNVWIPIEGCNEKSSLPVVSKSHLIPESKIIRTKAKGAYINGNLYHVPCIIETSDGPLKMTRPNPKEGEALIFTPYLIHGAAVNQNKDITRVALELRFDKL